MTILGAVLAGGRSSRFGSDKARAMLDGRALLDHAVAGLRPHVAAVVVCGGPGGLADRPAPGLGPLGGLAAALACALDRGHDGVLTTGCDMPDYPDALPGALVGAGAAVLAGQPLAGYWPAALSPRLDAHLARGGERSVRGWLAAAGGRVVTLPGLTLPNINTPADLAAARRRRP